MNSEFWRDKNVFVTGHTGFKGGWLTLWLHHLGAKIHGYSLNPLTEPALFDVANISSILLTDKRADILQIEDLRSALVEVKPDVIFHLAAQPLVRQSYEDPILTLETNIMGTANLLEAARNVSSIDAIVLVATDKVYQDNHGSIPFVETDRLGGHDPYSASKAAMELVVDSYRKCFYSPTSDNPIAIATVRSGNVIGGGDWSDDRLIPDCLRAFNENKAVILRNPQSIRPWQHVLEPLFGYLILAEKLFVEEASQFSGAWNFGPNHECDETVGRVTELVAQMYSDDAKIVFDENQNNLHETITLKLDSSKAQEKLNWKPIWSLKQSIEETVAWYHAKEEGKDMKDFSTQQIKIFENF